ncbi:hypothetical protein [Limnofasciculus baicalensis]|uniref:Uncharacterized protein n=1 Tax=Limnofasciculus baicalensis BBK-W-15 TaxID=2699891 RepID=A0AAE3H1W8_9CYAN|nr:hypothetical protein [Limnofasciculus baicalensis]MCP2732712.1 hypothetical protein [Limnofasciculus baicalensis BBK-W-15]
MAAIISLLVIVGGSLLIVRVGTSDEGGEYIATPTGSFRIEVGDVLTVYGQQTKIAELIR